MKGRRLTAFSPESGSQPDSDESNGGDWLRWIIIFATAWDLALVILVSPFAPPVRSTSISNFWLPESVLNRFYTYESLFYHSLSVPFAVALAYATLRVFQIRSRPRTAVASLSTLGFMLSSGGMTYVVLNGGNSIAFSLVWAGLGLVYAAGVVLVYALWPRRDPQASISFRGRNLVRLAMWVSVITTMIATVVGVYAASGSPQWGALSSFASFGLVVASHEHVVVTTIDAGLVALIVRHFRADHYLGTPGLFVKLGLYGIIVGAPCVTVSTFATVPLGVAAHNAITIFASILLQASLFIMYGIMVVEARNLGIRNPIGVFRHTLTYGLLFAIFWVNVVVTLPGIYAAVNLKKLVGLPNEVAFITGHEHVLVILTAMALLMLIAHIYGVGGKLGTFVGGTVTVGYVIGSAAATMYMFLDWNPEGSVFVPYLDVGLGLMIVGGMAALIGIAIRRQVCIHALPKTVRVVKRHSRFRILGKPLISIFLALLVTVSAVSAAIMMPPPGPGLAPGLRQLTSGPWEDRYPTWSPSGQLIAYITSRDGLDSVWVIRPNGLSDRRVSPVDVKAEYPSWAPNSASLAYYCLDGQRQGICVTNVADKSWKVVTDDSVVVVESRPQWSRDGSKLLFFRKGGNISLSVLDLPTGNTANIARMGDGNYSASWLSGSELVYSTRTGNHCEMKIVNLETGKNRTVFGDDENYVLPRVSPNGSKLSFFSDRPAPSETTLPIDVGDTGGIVPGIMIGGFNLWMSNLDGSDATYQYVLGHLWRDTEVPLQIPYSPGMIYLAQPPVWSDDSTKIAYVSLGSLTGYGIYVWDTATRSTVHIGSFQGDSLDPSWSPKGTDLLFSNNASGHCHIFIAYSAGAGTPQVAPAY